MNWVDKLIKHCEVNGNSPCDDSITWMQSYPDALTAFSNCSRGDWLLWVAVMIGVKRENIVLAACKCARQALVYVPTGEKRPLKAIETAERWAMGRATLDDVRVAYAAANAAYAAAYAAYAAAASAAAYAAYAAYASASASACAAAYAAYAAACAGDSQEDSIRLSADIVREMIGEEMLQSWKGVLCTNTGLTN